MKRISPNPFKSKRATYAETDGVITSVWYHDTPVFTFADGVVTLRSGGHRTYTTKARMNQAASWLGLNLHVYQQNFDWFVSCGSTTLPFEEGMVIDLLALACSTLGEEIDVPQVEENILYPEDF